MTRPTTFAQFVGQDALKAVLSLQAAGAKARGEILDHILLAGPAGLGKTTMARILSNMMGVPFDQTTGMALSSIKDLQAVLLDASDGGVFFVDEIHAIPKRVQQVLYTVMEDFAMDMVFDFGSGPEMRRLRLDPFTFVGATTHMGMLRQPLQDRFKGGVLRLEYYAPDELAEVVTRSATALGVTILPEAAAAIGRRSRGTPRIANTLLARSRDYDTVYSSEGPIDLHDVESAMTIMGVDQLGLNALDRRVLTTIMGKFRGGPVGASTLTAALGIENVTLEDTVEPFLIQEGLIERTSRGRVITAMGRAYLSVKEVTV